MDGPAGGLGGRSRRSVRDTRLAERALREQWPVPRGLRGPLMKRLGAIALDPQASPREAVAAARAILAASRLNLDAIGATIMADEHEELTERVAELEARLAGGRP